MSAVVAVTVTHGGALRGSVGWLVATYGVITVGELFLSPMGLSLVSKLAPVRVTGLMMGGWFLATSIGNKFSGFLGNVQNHMEPMWFFVFLAGLAAAVALFIFLVLPRLDRAQPFFNDTATTEIYTLSLHDALPI